MEQQVMQRHSTAADNQARLKLLFLTPRFPYPPIKGDMQRVYHQLRTLSLDHDVSLLCIADAPVKPSDYEPISDLCRRIEVVPLPRWRVALNLATGLLSSDPLQVHYYQVPEVRAKLADMLRDEHYDILHATLIRMLPYVWELEHPPVVVDLIDSLALNLEARSGQVRGLKKAVYSIEHGRVRRYEQLAVQRFPALIVTSPADRAALGGGTNIEVLPMGVDLNHVVFRDTREREPGVLIFTGNMGYEPNEEAVLWFSAKVWPLLRAKRRYLRWQIVGARPTPRVRGLHRPEEGVSVLGQVPDLIAHLNRATVSVCPLRTGSGIQIKVLEALAAGTPVVATSIANRGVQAEPGRHLLIADDPQPFADAVLRLLDDPDLRESLSKAGRDFIERNFRWEEHARRLVEIYGSVQSRV